MDFLFGAETPLAVRFFFAFVIVLGLIGATAYVVRRFGADRLGAAAGRGRQPRLAVVDAAAVDGRRRLVLVRRDNVEHLLMIGGPTDVVVEPNIVRAAGAAREAAPARPPATTDTLPRAVPLGEGSMWPLQPHPEPAAAPAPPAPRAQRPAPTPPPPVMEEPMQWHSEPVAPPPPPRQTRTPDPLAGLAAELARTPVPQEPAPAPQPRRPAREPVQDRTPERLQERVQERNQERAQARVQESPPQQQQPAPTAEQQYAATADQNLAEMAQRLEAALRRPGKNPEARAAEPMAQPPVAPPSVPEPAPAAAPEETKPRDTKTARGGAKPAQGKSLYDSLEQEMASLLGRPPDKV